jgi:hypothetical protein
MAQVVQYTVTSSAGFLFITGVVGTSVEGVAYALAIVNINKIVVEDLSGIINIFMNSSANHMFKYSELIDPLTGLPFGSLSDAIISLLGTLNSNSSTAASGLVYNSDQVYSSAAGDFTAAVVPGTKTITIAGLSFPISEVNLAAIKIIDINLQHVNLPINNTSVLAGVLTIPLAPENFLATDIAVVTIIGVQKKYDAVLDADRVIVQNPDWTHTTAGALLAQDSNIGELTLICDNAVQSNTTFEYSAGGLELLPIAWYPNTSPNFPLPGTVHNITTGEGGTALGLTDTAVDVTLSNAGNWTAGDEGRFQEVRRYMIPFDGYHYFTIQFIGRAGVDNKLFFQLASSLDPNASADSDEGWSLIDNFTNMSNYYEVVDNETRHIFIATYSPVAFDNILVRVVGGATTTLAAVDNDYSIYIKKSY